jgi:hypothetical protein
MGVVGMDDRNIEGQFMDLHVNRQGALVTIDTVLQWALEGRTFHAQQGNAATLVDLVEVAYDEDQPQFALRVPTGVTAIPLSIALNFQDQAGTNTHVIVSTTTNDIGAGTSTSLTESAMRSDAPHAAQCIAQSLYTGNATAATGLIEIARVIDPFVATAAGRLPGFRWSIREVAAIPILVGPASLTVHAVSTTDGPEGFAEYVWAEFPTPDLVRKV